MVKWITASAIALASMVCADAAAQATRAEVRSVPLEVLLEHAERNSPAMRVARARAERWRADAAAAEAPVPADPQVQIGVGPRVRGQASDVDVTVQIRQRLEIAGEPFARGAVASRAHDRWNAELDLAWFELHHAVHSTYHRALIERERVAVAARMLAFAERVVGVVRQRVEIGEDSPLELALADLERLRAGQRLAHEQHRYLDARLLLAELTGWSSDSPPAPAGALEPPRRSPPLDVLVALANEHGPQLAVLRAAESEALARAELAERDAWPEPTIGLNYQLEGAPGEALRQHQILGVLSVPIPLFHRNPVGRAEAEVEVEVARAERDAADATLRVRLHRLASTLDAAAAQLERYREELLPAVAVHLEQLERAFQIGEVDVLRVAGARERVLAAELEALAACEEYFGAVAALADAIGADPWPDSHHPGATR